MNTVTLNMNVSMSYLGVNQAECGIHIRVVAPQEYVNIYSARRLTVGVARHTLWHTQPTLQRLTADVCQTHAQTHSANPSTSHSRRCQTHAQTHSANPSTSQ